MNGTYGVVYAGQVVVGIGVFVVKDSVLTGADLAGGRYRGHVIDDPKTKWFQVVFDMFVPAGTLLVQNASPQEIDLTKKQLSILLEPDSDNGEPIRIHFPPGDVTLMIRRIPDENSVYASGVSVILTPV